MRQQKKDAAECREALSGLFRVGGASGRSSCTSQVTITCAHIESSYTQHSRTPLVAHGTGGSTHGTQAL